MTNGELLDEIVHSSALSRLYTPRHERVTARMASGIGLSHVSQLF
jgi:hypothetical protein